MTSLYERLGGTEGITTIASDLVDIHLENPRISPRYAASELRRPVETAVVSGHSGHYFERPLSATSGRCGTLFSVHA